MPPSLNSYTSTYKQNTTEVGNPPQMRSRLEDWGCWAQFTIEVKSRSLR
ncbi:hypothetical protein ACE1AT_04675 [Pelatocladus sp. BLCC-F211]